MIYCIKYDKKYSLSPKPIIFMKPLIFFSFSLTNLYKYKENWPRFEIIIINPIRYPKISPKRSLL